MWRKHVQPVAAAERAVLVELQLRRLTGYLQTQVGFEFVKEENGVEGTVVDYLWGTPFNYVAFLDGEQIHSKPKQETKDRLIKIALEQRGYIVDRFRYKPPIRVKRTQDICDHIEVTLLNLNYRKYVKTDLTKELCLNCGNLYDPEKAATVYYSREVATACPKCGCTVIRR